MRRNEAESGSSGLAPEIFAGTSGDNNLRKFFMIGATPRKNFCMAGLGGCGADFPPAAPRAKRPRDSRQDAGATHNPRRHHLAEQY